MGKGARTRAKHAAEHYGPFASVSARKAPRADGAKAPHPHLGEARASGRVPGRCYLCEQQADLEYGHVLPKWATKDFAGTVGAVAMSWDATQASRVRDGQKFYMLCGACERRLGQGEDLLKRLQRDKLANLNRNGLHVSRGADGLARVSGRKLAVLHRGLLGIAFKLAIVDDRPHPAVSTATLARLRVALNSDTYDNIRAPFAVMIIPRGAAPSWLDEFVSHGVGPESARYTLGRFHWFVPLVGGALPPGQDPPWVLLEHEMDVTDPRAVMWLEKGALDGPDLVARAVANARNPASGDPRGIG
jgi:hypothetical protein